MPTYLEHVPKYRCRKVNRDRCTLEMRTNGTQHDIPNTTHLREIGGRKEKMQRAYERGIKQICIIDMASIAYGKRHDKPQDKQTNKKARR